MDNIYVKQIRLLEYPKHYKDKTMFWHKNSASIKYFGKKVADASNKKMRNGEGVCLSTHLENYKNSFEGVSTPSSWWTIRSQVESKIHTNFKTPLNHPEFLRGNSFFTTIVYAI